LSKTDAGHAERVESELDVLSELVQKTSQIIRTLLFELRPLGLETPRLLSPYSNTSASFATRPAPMRLRLEAPTEHPPPAVEIEPRSSSSCRNRSTTRASTRARFEVAIYLYIEEGQLVASVRDRGHGFNLAAVESTYNTRGSLGLLNMRERARLIGGECRIRSAEGEGTTVRCGCAGVSARGEPGDKETGRPGDTENRTSTTNSAENQCVGRDGGLLALVR